MGQYLQDKVILITGASRGQGAADASLLARRGAKVVITDILHQEGTKLAEDLAADGRSAIYLPLDVSDEMNWSEVVAQVQAEFGRLDGLVNNAGVPLRGGSLATTSLEDWRRLMDINLTGAFLGIRTAAPVIAESGGGSIVNIGSAAGMVGHFATAYSVTKWGMRGLTKSAAMEFAGQNVRVNCVHPGILTTEAVAGSGGFIAAAEWMTPQGRSGTVDEIAVVVAFLLGDEATFITGIDMPVDGGLTQLATYRKIFERVQETGLAI